MWFEYKHLGTAPLQASHIMIGQSSVERKFFGQLAFNVLKLFPPDAE